MAEINNTQWLEEYLKMWTPKERMGRIHKVTTFDPTYHCYPEGVYLLDDDCRAHTAIYVVDKDHNVHIIYDGMAWDLLARAVEKGLLEISLKLSEGDKGLVAVLERMLAAQNTCCAGLQAKLKKIGDELERIADAVEGGAKPKPKPDPDPDPEPKPEKKTLFLAEPDRHEVTEDKKVYTSVITSIVKDVPEQPWTITDDFADYPSWATVSTDKGHVYITTDGSKPGKGTNDPWNPGGGDSPDPNPGGGDSPDPNPGGDDDGKAEGWKTEGFFILNPEGGTSVSSNTNDDVLVKTLHVYSAVRKKNALPPRDTFAAGFRAIVSESIVKHIDVKHMTGPLSSHNVPTFQYDEHTLQIFLISGAEVKEDVTGYIELIQDVVDHEAPYDERRKHLKYTITIKANKNL